jgi:hypothetical protein
MKKFLITISFVLFKTLSFATIYYVSASIGSDSNPGTMAAPFLTVQKCLNKVLAGDTCFIRAGTYNESLIIKTSGVKGALIIIKNYNGELAIINSGSSMSLKTNGKQSWYVIDGLRFISTISGGDGTYTIDLSSVGLSNGWPWSNAIGVGNSNITLQNCYVQGAMNLYGSNNTVQNCEFNGRNMLPDAIHSYLAASTHTLIKNNTIHDYLFRAVWIMSNADSAWVVGNNVYNTGHGIDIDGAARPVRYCHILHNIVTNSGGGSSHTNYGCALFLEDAFNAVVDGNLLYNSSAGDGIYVINYGVTSGNPPWHTDGNIEYRTQDLNMVISNNVIYGNGDAAIQASSVSGIMLYNNTISGKINMNCETGVTIYSQRWVVKNNIFTGSNGSAWYAQNAVSFSTSTFSNNLYWNVTAASGDTSLSADPKFVSTSDFHLQASSPAINAGYNLNSIVPVDFEGVPRPQDTIYDIGAFEYISPMLCIGKVPARPDTIMGNLIVCQGTSNTYSTSAIIGATNYTWKLPDGWTGTSTTNTIITKAGTTGGNITVIANNECDSSSAAKIISVTVNPTPATPMITLNSDVLQSNTTNGNQWYSGNSIIKNASDETYVPSQKGDYYVVITLNGCPSKSSNIITVNPTGIDETIDNIVISVYPNPANNKLTIEISQTLKSGIVSISDLNGQELINLQIKDSKNEIDISNLTCGVYIVKLYTIKSVVVKKILKK